MSVSRNLKYLYSIEDDGVAVFKRDGNGDLERLNSVDIEGMRGCFLSTDYSGNYLFVGGYHDGKVTLVEILPDGRLGKVLDGVFHRGIGKRGREKFSTACKLCAADERQSVSVCCG